ncbi:hypothetical protein [Streptosporangium sp. G12]
MRWFRRHRGSQPGDLAPVVHISSFPEGADPAEVARVFSYALADRCPPERLTARQVLTASLRKADFLAEGHAQALADGILFDLKEHGLTIVASGDVE